ncbi:hypothetical protein [uncultured Microbulbifer sp.]|uniref:hypothetical protein n=1 Tax=uncultured Microbulbifer sp. TaxID=348147 RepID=UPI002605F0BB|nr:hypothetical protein [uncultured Microbulbifer sp.]
MTKNDVIQHEVQHAVADLAFLARCAGRLGFDRQQAFEKASTYLAVDMDGLREMGGALGAEYLTGLPDNLDNFCRGAGALAPAIARKPDAVGFAIREKSIESLVAVGELSDGDVQIFEAANCSLEDALIAGLAVVELQKALGYVGWRRFCKSVYTLADHDLVPAEKILPLDTLDRLNRKAHARYCAIRQSVAGERIDFQKLQQGRSIFVGR